MEHPKKYLHFSLYSASACLIVAYRIGNNPNPVNERTRNMKTALEQKPKPTTSTPTTKKSTPPAPEQKERPSSKGIAGFIKSQAEAGAEDLAIVANARAKGYPCSINTVKKVLGKPIVKTVPYKTTDLIAKLPTEPKAKAPKAPTPKRAAEQIAEGMEVLWRSYGNPMEHHGSSRRATRVQYWINKPAARAARR